MQRRLCNRVGQNNPGAAESDKPKATCRSSCPVGHAAQGDTLDSIHSGAQHDAQYHSGTGSTPDMGTMPCPTSAYTCRWFRTSLRVSTSHSLPKEEGDGLRGEQRLSETSLAPAQYAQPWRTTCSWRAESRVLALMLQGPGVLTGLIDIIDVDVCTHGTSTTRR